MATVAEVKKEREAPTVAVELTERELLRVMKAATADEVRCEQASDMALSSIGEPAVYTLAEKLQGAFRSADFGETP
jgi:hypothetical protein